MLWRSKRNPAPAGFIVPCQPTEAAKPPSGNNWRHEIKHDGYRLMAWRDGKTVTLYTRNGNYWTSRYPAIVAAVGSLKLQSCILDGEMIVTDTSGMARFDLLRSRQYDERAALCAFDLLMIDGEDIRREGYGDRKSRLLRLFRGPMAGLAYNADFDGEGALVFDHACHLGCEGIVSKRKGSPYSSGRSLAWVKTKNPESEAVAREATEDWGR